MVVALSRFWDTHGHLAEGRDLLEEAILNVGEETPPDLSAIVRQKAGWAAIVQHDGPAARTHYQLALDYFRLVDDPRSMAKNLNCLAIVASDAGEHETALAQYLESLELYR